MTFFLVGYIREVVHVLSLEGQNWRKSLRQVAGNGLVHLYIP